MCAFPHKSRWLRISLWAEQSAWLQAGTRTASRDRQGQGGAGARAGTGAGRERPEQKKQAGKQQTGQRLVGAGRGMHRQEEGWGWAEAGTAATVETEEARRGGGRRGRDRDRYMARQGQGQAGTGLCRGLTQQAQVIGLREPRSPPALVDDVVEVLGLAEHHSRHFPCARLSPTIATPRTPLPARPQEATPAGLQGYLRRDLARLPLLSLPSAGGSLARAAGGAAQAQRRPWRSLESPVPPQPPLAPRRARHAVPPQHRHRHRPAPRHRHLRTGTAPARQHRPPRLAVKPRASPSVLGLLRFSGGSRGGSPVLLGEGAVEHSLCPVKGCRAGIQAWLFSILGLQGRDWT